MAKSFSNYDRRQDAGGGDSIEIMAERYTPAIKEILYLEKAPIQSIKKAVDTLETLVKLNARITTHQVRNIFSLIKEVDATDIKGLQLLRPRLAYIGARQKDRDGKVLVKVIDDLINSIDLKDDPVHIIAKIRGLQYIMESIVAYHKFHSKE